MSPPSVKDSKRHANARGGRAHAWPARRAPLPVGHGPTLSRVGKAPLVCAPPQPRSRPCARRGCSIDLSLPSEAPRPDFSRYPAERPKIGRSAGGVPLIRVYVLSPANTQAWVQVASWLHTWHTRCSTALTNGEGRDFWARWPWAGHGEARHLAPTAVTECRHLSKIFVTTPPLLWSSRRP
jgi:hypothetical protein